MEPYFQVGFVVPDLEAAMEELGAGLGVELVGPQERDLGDPGVLRIAFARTPPPYVELIQGPAGSLWDASSGLISTISATGPRTWTRTVPGSKRRECGWSSTSGLPAITVRPAPPGRASS